MNMQTERIKKILGKDCKRSPRNAEKYRAYLKKMLKSPCLLTGTEEFEWEISHIAKGWDDPEYQEEKKNNPSFLDQFELLELLEPEVDSDDIRVGVKRTADNKDFKIGLSLLECIEFNDECFQLIDDYAAWHRYF